MLMAIDAGTGSVRTVLFDLDGNQLAVAAREWEHKEDSRFPGSMDFTWDKNWQLCSETVRECIKSANANPADILAVATSSMREAIVLYDESKRELWACSNVDARANNEVDSLNKIKDGLEKEIYMSSGQSFALGALCRLLWVKNNLPEVYEQTKYVTMLNDWLTFKLSGEISAEPSNGCTTGIFDLERRKWDGSIATKCGIRADIFPAVYESGQVVGKISEECSRQTGLDVNTLVVVGGGDAQLGAVGAAAVSAGQAALFGGSFWQFEYNTAKVKFDPDCRIRINCHAAPGLWQYEAIAFFPGLIMRWYRDAFCQLEKEREKETGEDAYVQMDREAAKYPAGSNGMLCAFSNVMDYISWRHAAPTFTNFSIDFTKHNRYTFYRALMENAALLAKGHKELVESITGDAIEEIIFANGASKSPLWCQIIADCLGVNVKVPVVKESTALGAAICAGVGAGVYRSTQEACERVVKWERIYTPQVENSAVYQKLYEDFKKVYAAQLALADNKVTDYLWKAPGIYSGLT